MGSIKRWALAAMAVGLALAMVAVAAGCARENAAADAFAGTWDLTGMVEGDRIATAEDISYLKSVDMACSLVLASDGSADLDMFGESILGEWSATSTTEATADLQGRTASLKIERDSLVLTYEDTGIEMTFEKGED